jgi:hypothetical protein
MLGPRDGEGEESFDIVVCTPKWLAEKYGPADALVGLHKLIVDRKRTFSANGNLKLIGPIRNERFSVPVSRVAGNSACEQGYMPRMRDLRLGAQGGRFKG